MKKLNLCTLQFSFKIYSKNKGLGDLNIYDSYEKFNLQEPVDKEDVQKLITYFTNLLDEFE